jgi:hypothetical protein
MEIPVIGSERRLASPRLPWGRPSAMRARTPTSPRTFGAWSETADRSHHPLGDLHGCSGTAASRRNGISEAPPLVTSMRCWGKPAFGGSMPHPGTLGKLAAFAVHWDSFLSRLFHWPPLLSRVLFGKAFGTTGPSWQNPPVAAGATFYLLPLAHTWPQSENTVLT